MQTINLYNSHPADSAMQSFMDRLTRNLGREVVLLPISKMPAPDPQRRQALRVERQDLVEEVARHEATLQAYRTGGRQRDAGRENGLQYDIEALRSRLRAVDAILGKEAQNG